MIAYEDPLAFADASAAFRKLAEGYRDDMAQARRLEPLRQAPGAIVFLLPDLPWARRASGTLANDLAKANAGSAVAIVSSKSETAGGGYLVSRARPPRRDRISRGVLPQLPDRGRAADGGGDQQPPGRHVQRFRHRVRRSVSTMNTMLARMGAVYRVLRTTFGVKVIPLFLAVLFGVLRTHRRDRDGARPPVLPAAAHDARQPADRDRRQPADGHHVPAALPGGRGLRLGDGAVSDALPVAAPAASAQAVHAAAREDSARRSTTRPRPTTRA